MTDVKKKKRLIRLICKCKGEGYDESKEVNVDTNIKIDDVQLVIKSVLNVDVEIRLEE